MRGFFESIIVRANSAENLKITSFNAFEVVIAWHSVWN